MKIGRLLALGLITSQITLAVASEVKPTVLPPLVIYGGNRVPTQKELTNFRVDTVRMKVQDVDWKTVLQEQVQINETGPGGPVSLFLRGSNSNQTLFLIDGVRMSSATQGAPNFAAIAPGLLSSVDVIQGGTSAAFGSNAVGGVIRGNIDIPAGLMVSAGGGMVFRGAGHPSEMSAASFGVRESNYYAGVRVVQDIINQGSASNANNVFAYNSDNDMRKRVGVVAKAGGWIGSNLQIEATVLGSGVKTEFDGAPTGKDVNKQSISMANVRGIYSFPRDFNVMLTYGGSQDRSTLRGAYPAVFNTTSLQATAQLEKRMSFGRAFMGMDHEIQKVTSDTAYSVSDRTNVAGFLGSQLNPGRFVVEGMLRHDNNSQFGSFNTYSASLARKFGESWRVGGVTSQSFKAPTFNDLYWPMAWGFGGNPNLRPERGHMHEIFISYLREGASYRLGFFVNDIKDAIVINGVFSQMENAARVRIEGVEFNGVQPITKSWSVRLNVTGQDPRNRTTDTVLARRSQVFGTTVLRYAQGGFTMEAIARGEGVRYDDSENTAKLPAMVIAGLSAAYKLEKGPTLRLQVDNILDKRYQPAVGFNGIPRTVWVSVAHTF